MFHVVDEIHRVTTSRIVTTMTLPGNIQPELLIQMEAANFDSETYFKSELNVNLYIPEEVDEKTYLYYKDISTKCQNQHKSASEHGILVFLQRCLDQIKNHLYYHLKPKTFFLLEESSILWGYCNAGSQVNEFERKDIIQKIFSYQFEDENELEAAVEEELKVYRKKQTQIKIATRPVGGIYSSLGQKYC